MNEPRISSDTCMSLVMRMSHVCASLIVAIRYKVRKRFLTAFLSPVLAIRDKVRKRFHSVFLKYMPSEIKKEKYFLPSFFLE